MLVPKVVKVARSCFGDQFCAYRALVYGKKSHFEGELELLGYTLKALQSGLWRHTPKHWLCSILVVLSIGSAADFSCIPSILQKTDATMEVYAPRRRRRVAANKIEPLAAIIISRFERKN